MRRYEVQMAYLEDTLTGEPVKWYTLGKKPMVRRNKALTDWWGRVSTEQRRRMYRVYDRKSGKVVV